MKIYIDIRKQTEIFFKIYINIIANNRIVFH